MVSVSEKVLASFDFVVGSIHGRFALDRKAQTEWLLRAISDAYTTINTPKRHLVRRGAVNPAMANCWRPELCLQDCFAREQSPSLTFALGLTTLRLINNSDPGFVEFSRSQAEVLQRVMEKLIPTLSQCDFKKPTVKSRSSLTAC
jgi:hypothetical protein